MQAILIGCITVTPVSIILFLIYGQTILYWPRFLFSTLPQALFLLAALVSLVFGPLYWRKESRFYRLFTPMALAGTVIYWTGTLLFRDGWAQSVAVGLASGSVNQLYIGCITVFFPTALIAALWDVVKGVLDDRTEKQLLDEHRELALASYENMRRQHEEVMMLRHDMAGHLRILKEKTSDGEVISYLNELIGKNEKVRTVVQTGNEMLDIILNSKLSSAADAGIQVEILRASAPAALPLSDTDLCSLVMNILDNALTAASTSGAAEPFLRLDIHVKNEYLSILCENSADISQIGKSRKKETVPKHGLGLKIIRNITERHNGLLNTEYGQNYYKVTIALPLF